MCSNPPLSECNSDSDSIRDGEMPGDSKLVAHREGIEVNNVERGKST